jgi:1-acyl-sn-glycerol-3-phosphate acyltransferase
VRGVENLPKDTEAAVYVANHQSYLDIYSLFHLRRPFKARARMRAAACDAPLPSALTPHPAAWHRPPQFISKTSNFLIPIIGWSMYLTGHVPLKRMDRRSQMARAPRTHTAVHTTALLRAVWR